MNRPALELALFLLASTLAVGLLETLPEHLEAQFPAGWLIPAFLALAIWAAPVQLARLPFLPGGSLGILLAAGCTTVGRELFPDLAVSSFLLLTGYGLRRSSSLAGTSAKSGGNARLASLGTQLEAAGFGCLLASLGWRAAGSLPEAANALAAWAAAGLGSLTGDLWLAREGWLFPPGGQLRVDAVAAGWHELLAALAVLAGLLFRRPAPKPLLVRVLVLSALYIPLRIVVWSWLCPAFQPAGPAAFLWLSGFWQALTALPLLILLALTASSPSESPEPATPASSPRLLVGPIFALAAVMAGAAIGAFFAPRYLVTRSFDPTAVVVIDETHSDWEPALTSFDETTPEPLRQNNYVSLIRSLSKLARMEVWSGPNGCGRPLAASLAHQLFERRCAIDSGSLSSLLEKTPRAVLLLKCPTKPYSPAETSAIVDFVDRGGNVVMLGDHSDAFFLNTHLNPLASRFGIRFLAEEHYDAFGSWIETDRSAHPPASPFSPLTRFLFATNCPLEVRPPAFPLLWSRPSCFTESGDYFEASFFGHRRVEPTNRIGSFPMMAAARHGKGKVIAFSDSTSFNNVYFGYPDRRLLWYLWLDWMVRDGGGSGPWDGSWLPLAALLLLVLPLPWRRAPHLLAGLLFGAGLAWLACPGTSKDPTDLTYLNSIDPAAVLFDVSHGSRHAIGEEEPAIRPPGHAFYGPALEEIPPLGVNVRVTRRSAADPKERNLARLLVVVCPERSFSPSEIEGYFTFVRQGGRLLLVEGPDAGPAIDSLASPFGLEFSHAAVPGLPGWPSPSSVHLTSPVTSSVEWQVAGRTLFAGQPLGKGFVAALADDQLAASTSASAPRRAALDLFRHTVRALLSPSPGPLLAELAIRASSLDAALSPALPASDQQELTRAQATALFGRFVPPPPAAASPALLRLAATARIRSFRTSAGPVGLTSWPECAIAVPPSSVSTAAASPYILLAATPAAGDRLLRLAEETGAGLVPIRRMGAHASPIASCTLVIHPSALVADGKPLAEGLTACLAEAAPWTSSVARVQLLPPETLDQALASELLFALAALHQGQLSRWWAESDALDRIHGLLSKGELDLALRTAAARLGETVLPDTHLALMGLAAARAGRAKQAEGWLTQAAACGPTLRPLVAAARALLPAPR